MHEQKSLMDTPLRFGTISRILHWSMVGLIFLQLFSAILHFCFNQGNALRDVFWSLHFPLGFLLFVLVILRAIWGLLNFTKRPPLGTSFIGIAAHLGHLALYLLMLFVPLTALIRAYGSGNGFAPLGLPVLPATGIKNPDFIAVGSNFHGALGWVLLLLILGHIFMVYVHRLILKDGIDKRMSRPSR